MACASNDIFDADHNSCQLELHRQKSEEFSFLYVGLRDSHAWNISCDGRRPFLFLLGAIHLKLFESGKGKIFSLPGKYSYASYLFHVVVLYLLQPFLVDKDVFFAVVFYVGVTATFAFVSYRLYEFPMNNRVRGWFGITLKKQEA